MTVLKIVKSKSFEGLEEYIRWIREEEVKVIFLCCSCVISGCYVQNEDTKQVSS